MKPAWRLGEDLNGSDSLLAPITFDELIGALRESGQAVNKTAVHAELVRLFEKRKSAMINLMEDNMDIIIKLASEGGEQPAVGRSDPKNAR